MKGCFSLKKTVHGQRFQTVCRMSNFLPQRSANLRERVKIRTAVIQNSLVSTTFTK